MRALPGYPVWTCLSSPVWGMDMDWWHLCEATDRPHWVHPQRSQPPPPTRNQFSYTPVQLPVNRFVCDDPAHLDDYRHIAD